MDSKNHVAIASIFFLFFLLLTPLGFFNAWIPPTLNKAFYLFTFTGEKTEDGYHAQRKLISPVLHKGYYSVTIIDEGDDTGYYAYLRSAFFDGDIDFINELNYVHVESFNDTGYVFNHWQIGQSILFLPFFLAGHVHALILNGMGYPVAVDGYSEPYHLWTAIASQTYVFIGLLVLYRLLRKYYNPGPALLAVLASWLASPLVYYTFIRQRMAHGSEFFLSVIFVAVWLHYRESRDVRHHAVMGAVLGFLCITRLVGACYFFLYLVDLLYQELSNKNEALPVLFKGIVARLGSFSLLLLIVFLPQVYVWNQIDGSIITYVLSIINLVPGGTGSSELSFEIFAGLKKFFFTGGWALSSSSPAWFLGLIGALIWPPLFKNEIRLGFMAFFLMLIPLVVMTGGGAAYGARLITLGCPLFAFGLAAILQKTSFRSWLFWLASAFVIFCIFLQYLMIIQYKVTFDYNDPHFTVKALGAIPTLLLNHPELLLRSTNFVQLFFLDNPKLWDYRDILFLIIFPLLQLSCVTLLIYSQGWAVQWKDRLKFLQSEKIFIAGAVFSALALLILIGELAPSKTEKEISNRKIYSALLKKGKVLISGGRNDEAFKLFEKASRLKPGLWMPLYWMGVSYDGMKIFQEANEVYQRVLAHNPYHSLTLIKLGENFRKIGKYDKAEYYLKAAMRRFPEKGKIYNALGITYMKQNRLEEAKEILKTALSVKPEYKTAQSNLYLLEKKMNNPK